jgi:hypothetical protein
MSRNIRQRQPKTPVRSTRQDDSDSSLSDLSDDSGYSAVEAISDSDEDDDDDVKAAEEEHITRDWRDSTQSSPRPAGGSRHRHDEEEEEEELDGDDGDDEDDEEDEDDEADESASWEGIVSDSNTDTPITTVNTAERRVRFDVPDSDGDSTDTEDEALDFFPDIFVEQGSLDPSFRREIEQDEPDDSSNSGSVWDIYGMTDPAGNPVDFTSLDTIRTSVSDADAAHAAIFASFFDDDDSTPVATPLTSQETPTAVSTPAASPEKTDASSLDGYDSE